MYSEEDAALVVGLEDVQQQSDRAMQVGREAARTVNVLRRDPPDTLQGYIIYSVIPLPILRVI